MHEISEENRSEILQGAISWTPMLVADTIHAAKGNETRFSDPRVQHYWDPDRIFGRLLAQTLHLKEPIAWDVYLIYPPEHTWETELPPAPVFWMHQLNEEPTLYLGPPRMKQYVQTLIKEL